MSLKCRFYTILSKIKSEVLSAYPEAIDFIVFGSVIKKENPRDIDLALIVKDNANIFDVVRIVSPIIANHASRMGMLINIVPIQLSFYEKTSSQFLKNVRGHGQGL